MFADMKSHPSGLSKAWRKPRDLFVPFIIFLSVSAILTYWHHAYFFTKPEPYVDPVDNPIPSAIWQIFLPPTRHSDPFRIDPGVLSDTSSWLAMNPDYTYTLVGEEGANQFVENHFGDNEELLRIYRALTNPGLKSDLLRYLMLSEVGGTYTDIDTIALKPIDDWVPDALRPLVRVIVGIEYDKLDSELGWVDIPHVLQFCQWTIAAAPGHPLFSAMVDRALASLRELASKYDTTIGELQLTSFETMNSTGPAAWTDVVFRQLQLEDRNLLHLADLSGLPRPRLYGDILVMPIDSFGMGQPHSHSTNDGSIPDTALLQHNFRGSWRDNEG
ncbi:alpha-1,6-mannosyltransferase Och1 [Xylariomycetidae sp. FL0641]|nr:alpha-1,6-mannosyltransferase Och1 [Xylariomycetidae sp. FL0641]